MNVSVVVVMGYESSTSNQREIKGVFANEAAAVRFRDALREKHGIHDAWIQGTYEVRS